MTCLSSARTKSPSCLKSSLQDAGCYVFEVEWTLQQHFSVRNLMDPNLPNPAEESIKGEVGDQITLINAYEYFNFHTGRKRYLHFQFDSSSKTLEAPLLYSESAECSRGNKQYLSECLEDFKYLKINN